MVGKGVTCFSGSAGSFVTEMVGGWDSKGKAGWVVVFMGLFVLFVCSCRYCRYLMLVVFLLLLLIKGDEGIRWRGGRGKLVLL